MTWRAISTGAYQREGEEVGGAGAHVDGAYGDQVEEPQPRARLRERVVQRRGAGSVRTRVSQVTGVLMQSVYLLTRVDVHLHLALVRPISVYRLVEMPIQSCGQSVSAPRGKAGARLNAHTELRTKRQRRAGKRAPG